jgi:hypothetical protein
MAPTRPLHINEWRFDACEDDEIGYCWTYEYARESEHLRRIVKEWRQRAKGNKVGDYTALAEYISVKPFFLCVYPFFPCWPSTPYLSIEPKIRKEWLNHVSWLWDDMEELNEIQARYWSKESTLEMLERFAGDRSLSFRNGSIQYVVLNFDWYHHDNELVTRFRRWLKQSRPKDARAVEMRGRGNPASKGRANLKYLSAYRLGKKMPKDDAMQLLAAAGGKTKSYRNYQDWYLAVKKADAIIHSLEDDAFIVPLLEE